jgi:TetR/AcrR family transcriptional regulator, transcriptional repressor for nem operon
LLSKITSEGIRKHHIDPHVDPLKLSQLIIGSLEGALLISRLQKNRDPLHACRQHLSAHLENDVRTKSPRNPQGRKLTSKH